MPLPHLVRFDWAMKRLLRHKSNFVVLEGFLSSLFEEKITICNILESEGNKEEFTDKFNRVDLLAENSKGELIIVEVQNNRELDYFLRMLYGVSKAVTEYISEGDLYEKIRKVYSVNIVYFTSVREQITYITDARNSGVSITTTYCNYPNNSGNGLSVRMQAIYFRNIMYFVSMNLIKKQ